MAEKYKEKLQALQTTLQTLQIQTLELNKQIKVLRLLYQLTCAIYHNGKEKPNERWCFELGISVAADANVSKVLKRLHLGFGIKEKSEFLNIAKFKVKLLSKDFKPCLPEWPKGRIFSIDSQEQWETVLPKLLSHER